MMAITKGDNRGRCVMCVTLFCPFKCLRGGELCLFSIGGELFFLGVINICLTNLRLNLNSWNKCEHIFNQLSYYTAYPIKITCICFEIERWLRYEWVSDQRILVFMQEPYWMVNVVSQTAGVGFGGVVRCNCCNSVLFRPSWNFMYDKATLRQSFANARFCNCIEICCVCWISLCRCNCSNSILFRPC